MIRNIPSRKAKTEVIFDATLYTDAIIRHSDPDPASTSRSCTRLRPDEDASSQDSSTSSICIALDSMHEDVPQDPDLHFNDDLQVGDQVMDEDGVEWLCRTCFCETSMCSGKTLKRVDGKTELDPWDQGRPVKRQGHLN
ncbi:hypothetical protein T440DRAFT_463103 [Plenodomus tracheiphilus IPT5]|uniref:Uncharacterized protein n=1 Tax=Plenodomus tracheiphilus IPT5 TaxID=1408161 RepID=A0A6A7BN58_9PLEO|nr:hypothetical protein T440DRAFT_463103 [Plenodomus tracheiphilus IPT5]